MAQKDPDQSINKIVSYLIHPSSTSPAEIQIRPRDIYAMDETPVWEDMMATTTVEKKPTEANWNRLSFSKGLNARQQDWTMNLGADSL